ncbi:MAG TPA: hypothetical protein PLJ29_09410 [Leptospiraceae bacterium]|nr:hypothetical protein [Leptospiraceae bacterium]
MDRSDDVELAEEDLDAPAAKTAIVAGLESGPLLLGEGQCIKNTLLK